MSSSGNSEQLFEDCNHTELLQICRRVGLHISPSTPKEKMIAYLLGEEEPPIEDNVVDSWRHGLMGFVLDHWQTIRSQLACPAKTQDPRACFTCCDTQVIACVVGNPENEELINLKRKNEP